MIDWDLEAPGLHHYFHPFLIDPTVESTDGLIELILDYSEVAVSPPEDPEDTGWFHRAADVRLHVNGLQGSRERSSRMRRDTHLQDTHRTLAATGTTGNPDGS